MKTVEVLYFDGCPNVEAAADRAREAIGRAGIPADVRLVRIEANDDAVRHRFLGSPTIRVDGVDVEETADARTDYGLQCRVYWVDGKLSGAPAVASIEAALRGRAVGAAGGVSASACCAGDAKEPPGR